MSDRPELSVVIASVNGLPYPLECLEALEQQREEIELEVIVADCTGTATAVAIRDRFPWVKLLTWPEQRNIPDLRAAGVGAAAGRLVAVTEDHCVPRPGWARTLVASQQETGWAAVGGGVENGATERPIDWAVYFCEYANLMAPVPYGPATAIPGMNVVYDMDQLAEIRHIFAEGLWENVIHDRIRSAGFEIGLDPRIVVDHRKHFTVAMFLAERYHYSRAFAGNRVAGAGIGTRLRYAARSVLLPPVLLVRIVRAVVTKHRNVRPLVRSSLLVILFSVVWAIGEAVGYLFGPGDSLVRIR